MPQVEQIRLLGYQRFTATTVFPGCAALYLGIDWRRHLSHRRDRHTVAAITARWHPKASLKGDLGRDARGAADAAAVTGLA